MTTTVIVKANHGWPVRVTAKPVAPATGDDRVEVVDAGNERSFIVHSTQDLLIHEIQPDEVAAEAVKPAA
jgi:hypothetical protein